MKIKKFLALSLSTLMLSGMITGCTGTEKNDVDLAESKNSKTDSQKKITELVTEIFEPENLNYTWWLEPSIEADDIIVYDIEADFENDTTRHQVTKECAYIKQNGLWGVIGYDGNFVVEPEYKEKHHYTGDYFMVSNNDGGDFSVVHSGDDGLKVDNMVGGRGYMNESVYVDSETGELWIGGDLGSFKFSEYYEYSSFQKDYYKTDWCFTVREVIKSKYDESGNLIINRFNDENCNVGKYGIANKNGIVVPCQYDDGRYYRDYVYCTDAFSDACALKKDDKWAYFDRSGKQITDFIYDDCYDVQSYEPFTTVYLPTEGYIAVSNENGAGYCTTDGDEIIPTGTFEETRPMHNGKAWVKDKKTGLWGVMRFKMAGDTAKDWQTAYTDILNNHILFNRDYKTANKNTKFSLCYIDDNDIPELVVDVNNLSDAYVYTFCDGKVYDLGSMTCTDLFGGNSFFKYYERQGVIVSNDSNDNEYVWELADGEINMTHSVCYVGYEYCLIDGVKYDDYDDILKKVEEFLPSESFSTYIHGGEYYLTERFIEKFVSNVSDNAGTESSE